MSNEARDVLIRMGSCGMQVGKQKKSRSSAHVPVMRSEAHSDWLMIVNKPERRTKAKQLQTPVLRRLSPKRGGDKAGTYRTDLTHVALDNSIN